MSNRKKLSRKERKAVQAAIAKAKRTDKKEQSAQDSIPYLQMRPDGICQVTQNHFTKTIQFRDINYQLSDNEDKQAIFDGWCDFLNYFDSSVKFQLSFVNLTGFRGAMRNNIPIRNDQFASIQQELSKIIRDQQEKGNNGIIKIKYLTFGIDADGIRSAKPRLERIETDILNNFKRLGVAAEVLNGQERLRVLHDILRMDTPEPFSFSWESLPKSGLSTKDFIAPSSFLFNRARDFRIGKKFASVSFLQILAPELSDRILKDFLDIESNIVVNIHVQSVDQVSAIKTIKRTITDLDKTKIEEQKKAVRSGYDMDILPSDLATYGEEAKKLLSDLQSRNQRMFLVTFLLLNTADSKRQLDNNIFQTNSIAQKYNCSITALDYQQEEGLVSSLPLGLNQVEIQRGLTTSGVAIFVPFTTQELYQDSPEALYCGINALSNNIIMVDRKWLKNPNGIILGGRWEGTLMIGYQSDGRRKYKTFYGRTQAEVKKLMREYQVAKENGELIGKDFSFSEWADLWYENHRENIKPTTQESYKYTLRILKEYFGRRKISEIKAMDIEIFLKKLRRDGRSDSCLAQCRGMLFQIFNKAEANDLVKKNPVRFAEKMRKRPAKRKEAFTAEEVKLLLEKLPEDQIGWGIRLMLCTGMRTQELLGLEPRHIAEDGSYIVIEQAVVMEKGTAVIGTPKSRDSYRTIPIPKNVQYCARLLRAIPTKFCWERGKPDMPCNPSYFRKKFKEAISSVEGVRVLTPHSCRHTYVSQMQALGVDLATIQSLVGHADVDMTKHYLHVQDPVRLNAIALFDHAFFETDPDVHKNIIEFVKSS